MCIKETKKKTIHDGFMFVCVAEKCELMFYFFVFFYSSFDRQFSAVASKKTRKWWFFKDVCMCKSMVFFLVFLCTFPWSQNPIFWHRSDYIEDCLDRRTKKICELLLRRASHSGSPLGPSAHHQESGELNRWPSTRGDPSLNGNHLIWTVQWTIQMFKSRIPPGHLVTCFDSSI